MIPIDAYVSPEVFSLEIAEIFFSQWQPVAMLSDLVEKNDFIVVSVGGREVVVQNFGDGLSAFTNVCSHRFSAIQTIKCGNRPLQCPYHRWTFDKSGYPSVIPLREDFSCLDGVDLAMLALERWSLEVCGGLVFVCLRRPKQDLRSYLGNLYAWVESVTGSLGHEMESFDVVVKANWKILMQNAVEFQHVYSVHPETFKPMIEFPINITDLSATHPHIRYLTAGKKYKEFFRLDNFFKKYFFRPINQNSLGYECVMLFPCLTIGHVSNHSFSFFQYVPLSPGETRLNVRTWMPKELVSGSSIENFKNNIIEKTEIFIRKLSEEDRIICEAVYRGIKSSSKERHMYFSDGEFLVERFNKIYMEIMSV